MNEPLVSILTITHNRANLIHRCIESIQKQTYSNYEHIIIDGASTDDTEQVVMGYSDPHIRYTKIEEKGPAVQMQKAFELSKGELITFLDDDDEYLPEKVEKQVDCFARVNSNVGMVYCWMTYYDSNNPPMSGGKAIRYHNPTARGNVSALSVSGPNICGTPTLMVRREIIDELGCIYRNDIGFQGSDWEFSARICQITEVACLPESLVNVYVNHGSSQLTTANPDRLDRHIIFHKHFLTHFENVFKKDPKLAKYHYQNITASLLRLGRYKEGLRYYRLLIGSGATLKELLSPLQWFFKK